MIPELGGQPQLNPSSCSEPLSLSLSSPQYSLIRETAVREKLRQTPELPAPGAHLSPSSWEEAIGGPSTKVPTPPCTTAGRAQPSECSLQHWAGLDLHLSSATDKPWSFTHQEALLELPPCSTQFLETGCRDSEASGADSATQRCGSRQHMLRPGRKGTWLNLGKPEEHRRGATLLLGSGLNGCGPSLLWVSVTVNGAKGLCCCSAVLMEVVRCFCLHPVEGNLTVSGKSLCFSCGV